MTSRGSAYSRFKRALATGNPLLIRSTAAELPRIELADALAICLALAETDDDAYCRVAARFTARWSLELPAVSVEETQALGAALQALRAPDTAAMGRRVLAALVRVRGLERMERALAEHGSATRRLGSEARGGGACLPSTRDARADEYLDFPAPRSATDASERRRLP